MNLSEFHFIRPLWLLALLPAMAIGVLLWRNRLGRGNWEAVCDAALMPYLLQDRAAGKNRKALGLGGLAAFVAVIALAGPTFERLPAPVFRNETALVIALDLSRSMDAEDIKPSRLTRARYKIADLLARRKDGQTALLVFAGDAFTVTPLTEDTETIASQLEALNTDIMPVQGNRADAALSLAVRLLRQAGVAKGEILLVSDGVEDDSASSAAATLGGYRLSVLGVGTHEGAPIALPSGGFMKDEQGAIRIPRLDPDKLAALAKAGGGNYRTLGTDDGDIESVLANLGGTAGDMKAPGANALMIDQWNDVGPWLVLALLPLAALSFRRGLLGLLLALALPWPKAGYALEWQDWWQTRDQQAAQAFAQKNYERAAELFENPDWKAAAQYRSEKQLTGDLPAPQTATGFYNQGNVLAKSGRLEEAIAAYEKSLSIDPNNADAEYNKKLVEEALKRQQQNQQNRPQKPQQEQDRQQENNPQDSEDGKGQEQNPEPRSDGQNNPDKEQNSDSGQQERGQKANEKSKPSERQAAESEESPQKPPEESSSRAASSPKEEAKHSNPPESNQARAGNLEAPADEAVQANQQWLNRIPDDPGGLLKRKFQYQYSQRRQRSDEDR